MYTYTKNSCLFILLSWEVNKLEGYSLKGSFTIMKVFELDIPSDRALTNFDLISYIKKLGVPYFRGIYMRNTLPKKSNHIECGILNFNTSDEIGSH